MRYDENIKTLQFETEGAYDFPIISPENTDCVDFIGFNYAKSAKVCNVGVHFFLDDYQFIRLWKNPINYIAMLKKFDCVLTPDFSLYTDMPQALQIYNRYRSQWIGAFLQSNLITTIPTVSWSDESSFSWCFDALPKNSCVAVSSVGTQKNKNAKELFIHGYNEMIDRLSPSKILFYGNVPDECNGNIIKINPFQNKFRNGVKTNGR